MAPGRPNGDFTQQPFLPPYYGSMDDSIKSERSLLGLGLGAFITPVTLFFAINSALSSHGGLVAARFLYPIPMLLSRLIEDRAILISLTTASIQFPVYGYLIGWSLRPALAVVLLHTIAAVLCFSGMVPGFN